MDAYFSLLEKFSLETPEKPDFYVISDAEGVRVMHPVLISDQSLREIEELRTRIPELLAMNSDDADEFDECVIDQIIDCDP